MRCGGWRPPSRRDADARGRRRRALDGVRGAVNVGFRDRSRFAIHDLGPSPDTGQAVIVALRRAQTGALSVQRVYLAITGSVALVAVA